MGWRVVVENGDDRAAGSGELNRLEEANLAVFVDDRFDCTNHNAASSPIVARQQPTSCELQWDRAPYELTAAARRASQRTGGGGSHTALRCTTSGTPSRLTSRIEAACSPAASTETSTASR